MGYETWEWTGSYVLRSINGYNLLVSSGYCPNRKWTYELNDTAMVILDYIKREGKSSLAELIPFLNKKYGIAINSDQERVIESVISDFIKIGVINGTCNAEGFN